MKIQINSKFNIGDIVQKYKTRITYTTKIKCPLCQGTHKVLNPNYDVEEKEDECMTYTKYMVCPYCENGLIESGGKKERYLDNEKYYIQEIFILIDRSKNVKYRYSIESTPELNNRLYISESTSANEEELKKVEDN